MQVELFTVTVFVSVKPDSDNNFKKEHVLHVARKSDKRVDAFLDTYSFETLKCELYANISVKTSNMNSYRESAIADLSNEQYHDWIFCKFKYS